MREALEVTHVEARARPGTDIGRCAMAAAIMALQEDRVVAFTHNNRRYLADPRVLASSVLRTGHGPEEVAS